MKFCPECGSAVTESNKFCPNCGFQLSRGATAAPAAPSSTQSPPLTAPRASPIRPGRQRGQTVETLLGLVSMLFGLLLLVFGVVTATVPTGSVLIAWLFIAVYIGAGLLVGSVGYALLLRKAWLERTRRAAGVCSLLLAALFLVIVTPFSFFMTVLGLVLCVGLLYYLSPKRRAARNGPDSQTEIV